MKTKRKAAGICIGTPKKPFVVTAKNAKEWYSCMFGEALKGVVTPRIPNNPLWDLIANGKVGEVPSGYTLRFLIERGRCVCFIFNPKKLLSMAQKLSAVCSNPKIISNPYTKG